MRQFIVATVAAFSMVGFTAFAQEAVIVGGIGVGVSIDVERVPQTKPFNFRSGNQPPGSFVRFSYAAKFTCGTIPSGPSSQEPAANQDHLLVPGTYLTAINVHNPNNIGVKFAKKAVRALPQLVRERLREENPDDPRLHPGPQVAETLGPYEALEVDCVDILKLLGGPVDSAALRTGFLKGFVVLEVFGVSTPLDVVAVYTLKNVESAVGDRLPPPSCETSADCPTGF